MTEDKKEAYLKAYRESMQRVYGKVYYDVNIQVYTRGYLEANRKSMAAKDKAHREANKESLVE